MKPKYDEPLSIFALDLNLHHYSKAKTGLAERQHAANAAIAALMEAQVAAHTAEQEAAKADAAALAALTA